MTPPRSRNLITGAAVLLVALNPATARAQTPPTAAPAVRVDPVAMQLPHISVATTGKGSPVVLIPGLSSPRATWDAIVPDLARRHQVILVQVNGFAGDAPGDNLKPGLLDGIVTDLHAYLAGRRLSRVPVVGHSLGGLVTMLWAKAHPADVGKAMIVDSLPFIGEIFVPGSTVAMLEPQAKAMSRQLTASYGRPPNLAYVDGTANALALKPESRAKVKAWMLAADARVSAQALYEDMTTDLRPDLPAIATPLTVVVPFGGALTEDRARALYGNAYAKAPNAKIVTVGDSAHFVMLDQPAAFQAALNAFLAK